MSARRFPYNVPVGSRYGAPMGRRSVGDLDGQRVTVRAVPLSGGYDPGGAYWGTRPPGVSLFCAWTPDRSAVRYVDAASASDALRKIEEA